jgi:dimeric dUTPase (all-alpha-NTP-PPase superfamily)
MIIDFRDIVKEQKQLNAQIFANHGITNEKQKFNELKLALLVELGELANEVKSFKY